ncbi:MAG: DUF262 domain-containing protein [Betaproteobacteria bacterium]
MATEAEELEVDEVAEESEAFVTYDIASYPSDLTLSVLAEMWHNGDIVIPEFQRNFVWNITQSSLLIESFLLGLPVPQVFFYVDAENKNLVIDGQQRLLSVVYYLDGYFGSETTQGKQTVFRLTGLDERSPYAKKRFSDLDEAAQRKLKGAVLRAINIRQLNPKGEHTSIYHIFERLNTGGTALKPQEIRNCVFRGGFAGLLRDLNKYKAWRKILGKSTFDKHQKDVELLLRIFALSQTWSKYEKPMKEYLNVAMSDNRSGSTQRVKWFSDRFSRATEVVVKALGPKPFHIRGPLNSSALDSVLCTVIENIERVPANLAERFAKLKDDKEFRDATFYGTSDVTVLQTRFKVAEKYLIK